MLTGLVLSGGRGRRMEGMDKGLVPYRGRPLICYALDALKTQTDNILVSANRNIDAYSAYGYPIVSDTDPDFRGPLSGVLAGMRTAGTPYLLTIPCDMPKVEGKLLQRLVEVLKSNEAPLIIAHDGERLQPLLMLARTNLSGSLHDYLDSGGRRVDAWVSAIPHHIVDLSDHRTAFVNFNDLQSLHEQEQETHG